MLSLRPKRLRFRDLGLANVVCQYFTVARDEIPARHAPREGNPGGIPAVPVGSAEARPAAERAATAAHDTRGMRHSPAGETARATAVRCAEDQSGSPLPSRLRTSAVSGERSAA